MSCTTAPTASPSETASRKAAALDPAEASTRTCTPGSDSRTQKSSFGSSSSSQELRNDRKSPYLKRQRIERSVSESDVASINRTTMARLSAFVGVFAHWLEDSLPEKEPLQRNGERRLHERLDELRPSHIPALPHRMNAPVTSRQTVVPIRDRAEVADTRRLQLLAAAAAATVAAGLREQDRRIWLAELLQITPELTDDLPLELLDCQLGWTVLPALSDECRHLVRQY